MEDWIMMLKAEKLFEDRRLAYGEEQARIAAKEADIIKTLSLDEIKKLETTVSRS